MRVVIADDEELARERLAALVAAEGAEVVAACANGDEAVRAVREQRPDVVLLDIEMPRLNGLDVAKAIGVDPALAVIFVTAFDRYAVDAFDVRAADYLLKPIRRQRLRESLARVRSRMRTREPLAHLLVRDRGSMRLLALPQIDWIESAENYVHIHSGAEAFTHRATLAQLEQRLTPRVFLRVSRTAIVNLNRVIEVQSASHGDLVLVLGSGARVKLNRTHRHRFEGLTS